MRYGLERLLHDIRTSLRAEVALALYHGLGGERHARVLARSADSRFDLPLPNEPLWLGDWSRPRRPASSRDLVFHSAMRQYQLELVSALIVPWAHTSGRGWLVAGMAPGAWNSGSLELKRAQAERHRLTVRRRLEQERLAFQLHDSVVRSLMEIGLEAENGLRVNDDPTLRSRFERIGHAAEACLQTLREQLAQMVAPGSVAGQTSVGEVIEALRAPRAGPTVPRTFRLAGTTASRSIPARVALALISIGQEALRNVDLHSGASAARVLLAVGSGEATLRVSDDGGGMHAGSLSPLSNETSGHLGLFRMRRAATDLGGRLALVPGRAGGLCVEATIPLH